MKISASYWMFEGGLEASRPIAEAMQEARDVGFDAIELCIASEGVLTHNTTQSECEDIVATAEKIGIEISSVASGQSWEWSPSASDPDVRDKIIDFTGKALRVTKWLGTDAYLFVPGAVSVFFLPDGEVVPYEVCYKRAAEGIPSWHSGQTDSSCPAGASFFLWASVKYWLNMAGIISPIPMPIPPPAPPSDSAAFSMAMAAFICISLFISLKTPIRLRSSMAC